MRLLIAEDDIDLAEALSAFLERSNFTVDTVNNGSDAFDYAMTGGYDAVILDIMMPVMDGLQVLKKLREGGASVPVMLLTAKGEKDDRVLGFDTGADDYLPKPFAPDELLARLRAIIRRGGSFRPGVLSFGDISFDCGTGNISCGGLSERLSGREFQIFELFMRSPGILIPADRLMERIWGWDAEEEINVVWVHISNLRKKLKAIGSHVVIRAIRGLGYVLEAET